VGAVLLLALQTSNAMKLLKESGLEDTPCDWPTGQQYWPHPTNCHMFVQCTPYGPQGMHCAPGTAWSQSLLACDFEANTDCEKHQPTSPPKAPSTSAPKAPSETSIACEGSDLNITCEAGNLINLISVNYGRSAIGQDVCDSHHDTSNTNCKSSTSMEEVAERCSGKVSCSVAASNAVFGDPCRNTYKYLEVQYTCEPPQTSIACEKSELNISCESGKLINLISANYGRSAIGQDVCDSHHDTSNTNCKSSTSMEEVAERCSGKVSCSVAASNKVFGDPCRGTYKYLEVQYTCEPQVCPSPYKLQGTECLFVSEDANDLLNWDESRQRCLSMGGDLAQPHNMVEFVQYIEESYPESKSTIWLGATDREVEQEWYWLSGEPVPPAMWKPWPANQPSGDGNCMEIHWWPHTGFYMNDWHCHNKGYFACEFNMIQD